MAVRLIAFFCLWASAGLVWAGAASPWGGHADTGKTRIAVCSACHGMDGQASAPIYPSLAGQHETYIVNQLNDFKLGHRRNPIMLAMSQTLSEQDMHDIGAWFASQSGHPAAAPAPAPDVAAGARLYRGGDAGRQLPACMACHGGDALGNPGSGYPKLRGQSATYLVSRLTAWQQARLPAGHPHADIMPSIARQLSPADIQALADYLQQLDTAAAP
ncbi:c-type cytochrome [Frateuria aurantia]|uniref:Cytochrome c553 n=1 Tax=Frateuria aurantia (strain ATCC 33424 / DSM 6220 / KCTC 2777 / LMG 1558 / NBRC 3245 / NCIMB 13370) TaxID=767434 RepID=H8KZJ3_FRAAD|nr:c-type cytochrome [Frateuria aurantia]AFC87053.1 cytochrome c553 [Frateuria aurantia DSM 6220]